MSDAALPAWDPLTEWKHQDIDWVRVDISKEDLLRFTERSYVKGLLHTLGFLAILAATGGLAWWGFQSGRWVVMVVGLYFHGLVYGHFGDAIHELDHGTVFPKKWLNTLFVTIYGLLYWPWNPHMYRLSHLNYHHRYTLHQGSDGEDTPNYVEFKWRNVYDLFFNVLHFRELFLNVARLLTLKPTTKGWRGRGYALDSWEQFILGRASSKDRRAVERFAVYALVSQILWVGLCVVLSVTGIVPGMWFLLVLTTLAPFYGPYFHSALCGTHQHAACEANHPDFRVSCGSARLDPLSSFLYWHMEYHIEHHMFAAIPCYNLKAFRAFVEDQMPEMKFSVPRLSWLHHVCKEKYGSWQYWRDHFGRFKGI